jgi:hypothetical protein
MDQAESNANAVTDRQPLLIALRAALESSIAAGGVADGADAYLIELCERTIPLYDPWVRMHYEPNADDDPRIGQIMREAFDAIEQVAKIPARTADGRKAKAELILKWCYEQEGELENSDAAFAMVDSLLRDVLSKASEA